MLLYGGLAIILKVSSNIKLLLGLDRQRTLLRWKQPRISLPNKDCTFEKTNIKFRERNQAGRG